MGYAGEGRLEWKAMLVLEGKIFLLIIFNRSLIDLQYRVVRDLNEGTG